MTLSNFLTLDHRDCDDKLAQTEHAVSNKKWDDALISFTHFHDSLLHHFQMEEQVMFPAFETKTGMQGGPTQMMRIEHEQMRALLAQLGNTLNQKNIQDFFGFSETLMMLIQQHNAKEEQMLYRMADQHLAGETDSIIAKMQSLS